MVRTIRKMPLPGTPDPSPRAYEAPHAALSRRAAAEGFVLLKNEDHLLPLDPGKPVALYGAGASKTVKGGTGSGDVNERYRVSIYEGLTNAGFTVTTGDWIAAYDALYERARLDWRERVLKKYEASDKCGIAFFDAYSTTAFHIPAGPAVQLTQADTAIYVLSRIAGEGADRHAAPGDYYLSPEERAMLSDICRMYRDVVVLLNTGSVVDLGFMEEFENIRALMLILQPGMEGGNAVADVLTGRVCPSGRLTDTWALRYEDYPGAADYSHNNGDVSRECYNEGIYVGYRFFDSFGLPVRHGFGEGLSYTTFEMSGIPFMDVRGTTYYDTCIENGKRPCGWCRPKRSDEKEPLHLYPADMLMGDDFMSKDELKKMWVDTSHEQWGATRRLTEEEKVALKRHKTAARERARKPDNLTEQQSHDFMTLTQPGLAFWAQKGYSTFHLRNCRKIGGLKNLKGFARYSDAIHSGYKPCRFCKPTSRSDIIRSVPIYQKVRDTETVEDLDRLCDELGWAHRREDRDYFIETPTGKWKIITGTMPVDVYHINKVTNPTDDYHKQHRLFISMTDTVKYILLHDKALIE